MEIKNKIGIIDIDTFIFQAALSAEENYVTVTHNEGGWSEEYPNKTTFYKCTKADEVTGEILELSKRDKTEYSIDDFTITQGVRLTKPDDENMTPLSVAKGRFNAKIKDILKKPWCKSIKICYGYGTNFRYDLAKTFPYKNDRKPKPILHKDLTDWVLRKYKSNLITKEGVETDDIIVECLYRDWYKNKGDISKLKYVGVFYDKDIPANAPFLMYNPNKESEGVVINTPLEAARKLCIQMIMGDTVDTIKGIPFLTEDICEKYSIRKSKGAGEASAFNLIKDCTSIRECFERVVEAYKGCYGLDTCIVKGFRGEGLNWTWLDHMNEQYSLLRMQYHGKPVPHVEEVLKALKIDYRGEEE